MGARAKLNRAFFNGSLILAGLTGMISGSWLIFSLALAALIAVNVVTGEIRFRKRQH